MMQSTKLNNLEFQSLILLCIPLVRKPNEGDPSFRALHLFTQKDLI